MAVAHLNALLFSNVLIDSLCEPIRLACLSSENWAIPITNLAVQLLRSIQDSKAIFLLGCFLLIQPPRVWAATNFNADQNSPVNRKILRAQGERLFFMAKEKLPEYLSQFSFSCLLGPL